MTITLDELIRKLQCLPDDAKLGTEAGQITAVVVGDTLIKFTLVSLDRTDEEILGAGTT
ncbi:hypothetical protein [Nostoc sp. ChiSLP03a]|uniref:hypothetical protein n=1 Tax=Nostoc sp. ChiSLP03a TaxID=3075380 RepID=UPI002AD43772|nr:hypothetical protein [Nostoc sp. ChiSLP03a]MDZ8211623.1 hypothetical protein [Nostoc sp. ChiSLP03a]